MHKFAFLVHLRNYREDLGVIAKPLGWVPEAVYRSVLDKRPLSPFIWSEVRVTAGADEAEGYIIMLPYSGKQLLEQPKQMLPLMRKAMMLAASKGVKIMGLGALTSPISLGGKLLAGNRYMSVTNGNAFTAVTIFNKVLALVSSSPIARPVVAIVGATGSVGSLVSLMLAGHKSNINCVLIARNARKLSRLASEIADLNPLNSPDFSESLQDTRRADILVLVTTASEGLLESRNLKHGAIIVDATQPRNTSQDILTNRQDIQLIDGGLVTVKHLSTNGVGRLGLPAGVSFACLAETMLLALAEYEQDFSIGNPTLEQAAMISKLAAKFGHLGFDLAPDHRFGKPIRQNAAKQVELNAGLYF